jgi:hypothetical protein
VSGRYFLLFVALVALTAALFSSARRGQIPEDATIEKSIEQAEVLPLPPLKRSEYRAAMPSSALPEGHNTHAGPSGTYSEFVRLTQDTLAALPRREALRGKSSAEVHHAPSALLKASAPLARVDESIRTNPALTPQGIQFYYECAMTPEILTAVRALCLRNFKHYAEKEPGVASVRKNEFPSDLWDLTLSLPSHP